LTIVHAATANRARNESEHPWPGYLTLIDVLYARAGNVRRPEDREINLVSKLPIAAMEFVNSANTVPPRTLTGILDTFADLVSLEDGLVAGQPQRAGPAAALPFR
jgi:hypothetical protein